MNVTTPIPPDRPSGSHPGKVTVHVFGRTDVGRTREHNEDSFVVADLSTDNATLQPEVRTHVAGQKGTLFMVADGMGGAAAGEIASAMATDIVLQELRETWRADPDHSAETFARSIKEAAKIANERIHQFAVAHPEYRGMGTTATIAGLLGDTVYLAQVGDSRGYLVRDGQATQITKDQSLNQKLIEAGELTEEEAEHNERRNIILQALGPEPTVKVDLTYQRLRRGDTLVLCSDGLSTQIARTEIGTIAGEETDLTAACKRLIDRANEMGGPDNITVIVARFEGEGLSVATSADEVAYRVFPLNDSGATPTPVMGVDRVTDGRPSHRPTPLRVTKPIDTGEFSLPEETAEAPLPTPPPLAVSDARRAKGQLMMRSIIALLAVAGLYFLFQFFRR